MFRNRIANTPFTVGEANSYFSNIRGEKFNGDISFLSTLRALVAPRMKDNDSLNLAFNETNYSDENVRCSSVRSVIEALAGRIIGRSNYIYIHNLTHPNQASNIACIESLKSSFSRYIPGWELLPKVTDFFRNQFNVICFINPSARSVAIYTDNMDMKKMHYLQCSIFAFLPWYFNPEEGASDEEMELINSLRGKSFEQYIKATEKIASKYDFRAQFIKKNLSGFELKYEKAKCGDIRNQIRRCDEAIHRLNREIAENLNVKNEKEIFLLGLETKIAKGGDESEIMDYFLCNKKLALKSVDDTSMTFAVKDYIAYFDEDMAENVISNKHSYVYINSDGSQYRSDMSHEDMELLMKAIFIQRRLKIKVCAGYYFSLYGDVEGLRDYDFDSSFAEYMPNPHINRYSCLGNYVRTINELLKDRNYIGAIEQCSASAKSLNFGDSTVMHEFMRFMYGSGNRTFIELPDGTTVSPVNAIKWLKEQENNDEQNN